MFANNSLFSHLPLTSGLPPLAQPCGDLGGAATGIQAALLGAAIAFSLLSGVNDGGTIVAVGTRTGAVPILFAFSGLATAVVLVPAFFGSGVATTIAHGLVSFETRGGDWAFLAAVSAALLVVFVVSRRGLPTSLTLALTGGIIGAGIGARLPLTWSTIALVLAAGLLGPLAAAAVAFAIAAAARALYGGGGARSARLVQRVGFALQSTAYAANDAEKLVAFMAIATGASLNPVRVHLPNQIVIGLCFAVGSLLALRRLSTRLTQKTVRAGPADSLSAAFASSAVVLAGSAVGIPVPTTTALTAGLLGASARLAPSRIRLEEVVAIAVVWGVTLPSAALVGAALGLLTKVWR